MYTIKQASARSGVPVQLLRAWERRYGIVEPERTAGGYRLYDDASIARLRSMRALISEGWSPSTAAAHIRDMDADAIQQLAATKDADAPRSAATDVAAPALTDAFVAAAVELDEPLFERVLDEMFARGSFEQVTTNLVMPALVALGEGWASGRLDVAAEHAAAGAVQRRLGLAFMSAGAPRVGDVVLVGLPPRALHDLGALAFATAARRAGLSVRYVGADLPIDDWIDAIARTDAAAVVIGAVIGPDARSARDVGRAIRAVNADVVVCFGGPQARSVDTTGLEPVVVLPEEISQGVAALESELGSQVA